MPGAALSLDEREVIAVAIGADRSLVDIAVELGRDPSTIRREVARNGGRAKYSAVRAQRRADRRRARPKLSKLEADPVLAAHVAERLQAKDSPVTISIELARGVHGLSGKISHETIYQALYRRRGLDVEARECLHLKRRRRKPRTQQRPCTSHSLQHYQPISDRPLIALQRVQVGHFEGDLITGAYNRSAKITMFDRASRRLWLRSVASKSADDVLDALVELLLSIPAELRRTLTWDQGSELARHLEITDRCGIDIYICDKNAPWQRPTNENGNAFVRRYVGNGTDLNLIDDQHCARIEHRINTTPRRSLNWDTANDVYARLSALTT
jgi:IS30 family transposase